MPIYGMALPDIHADHGMLTGMARTGRPKAELTLSDDERATLQRWARRAKSSQALALRANIILTCAQGHDNKETAALLRCHQVTVGKWRKRFIHMRLDGLADEPRPGRVPTITDEQVEKVIVDTLEETPDDATHWSRASMAERSGLSRSTIGRIWKAFHLKPHLADTFKLSSDPLFAGKVCDVIGLYLSPPEHAVVLCADEKSQVQALDRSQPVLPMMPGMPEKRTHDYVRHGTLDLFAASGIATGVVIAKTCKSHRAKEWIKFLEQTGKQVPRLTEPDGPGGEPHVLQIHIIADNYATHKTPAVQEWLAKHPRFRVHFTPTSSSWLNQVERWFGLLTGKLLRRGAHKSVRQLEKDILAWVDTWNENPRPFIWTKSAEEILESLGRLLQRIKDPGHQARARLRSELPPVGAASAPACRDRPRPGLADLALVVLGGPRLRGPLTMPAAGSRWSGVVGDGGPVVVRGRAPVAGSGHVQPASVRADSQPGGFVDAAGADVRARPQLRAGGAGVGDGAVSGTGGASDEHRAAVGADHHPGRLGGPSGAPVPADPAPRAGAGVVSDGGVVTERDPGARARAGHHDRAAARCDGDGAAGVVAVARAVVPPRPQLRAGAGPVGDGEHVAVRCPAIAPAGDVHGPPAWGDRDRVGGVVVVRAAVVPARPQLGAGRRVIGDGDVVGVAKGPGPGAGPGHVDGAAVGAGHHRLGRGAGDVVLDPQLRAGGGVVGDGGVAGMAGHEQRLAVRADRDREADTGREAEPPLHAGRGVVGNRRELGLEVRAGAIAGHEHRAPRRAGGDRERDVGTAARPVVTAHPQLCAGSRLGDAPAAHRP